MVGSIRVHYLQCCVFQMFSGIEQPAVIFLLFLFYYQGILNPALNPQHLQERLHSHSTFQSYQPLETLYITNRIHLFKHIHKEPLIMYIQCFLLLYTCAHTPGKSFHFFVGLDNDTYTCQSIRHFAECCGRTLPRTCDHSLRLCYLNIEAFKSFHMSKSNKLNRS